MLARTNRQPKQHAVNKVDRSKKSTSGHMRLATQIDDFDMDHIILDLGFDANVLPKQTWERIGKPNL